MKRTLLSISLAALLLAPLAAQTVTVTSPNGGETWVKGTPHDITWTFTNAGSVKVDIILRRSNNTKVGTIKSNWPLSAGSWPWPSVGTLEDGTVVEPRTDYIVRIRDAGDTFSDDSNGAFSINEGGGGPPALQLLSPNGGETWPQNSIRDITWSAANWSGSVQLNLRQDGAIKGIIAKDVPAANGKFPWKVGTLDKAPDIAGSGCRVNVVRKYKGGSRTGVPLTPLQDDSDNDFYISPAGAPPKPTKAKAELILTYPKADTVWFPGETRQICWTAEASVEYPLKVMMANADNTWSLELGQVGSGIGFRPEKTDITVPETDVGKYFIRIYNEGLKAAARSQLFQIAKKETLIVPGTAVNYADTHYKNASDYARSNLQIHDPGPNKYKYGYAVSYWTYSADPGPDDDHWVRVIHRSHVRFDFTDINSKMKGKPVVKHAEFLSRMASGSPNGNCTPIIWVMDAPVPLEHDAVFYPLFDSLPKHKLTKENCAFMVQLWLVHPEMNYGLVVQAEYEGDNKVTGSCVQIMGDIVLQCRIEEHI